MLIAGRTLVRIAHELGGSPKLLGGRCDLVEVPGRG
jgi:hypothetical protein